MQNFVLGIEVGGEAFPSMLNWEPGVPNSSLNSNLIMEVQGSASHACPTARLTASTPPHSFFPPLEGLSTANRQMEEGCKIIVERGGIFH